MRFGLLPVSVLAFAFCAASLTACSVSAEPAGAPASVGYNTMGYARPVDYRPSDGRDYHDVYDHRYRYDEHEYGRTRDDLRQVYHTLAIANHNYQGHRRAAMDHIKHALEMMGTDIGGNGEGGERQFVSNDQLRHAEDMINHLRDRLHGRHPAISAELDKAAHEVRLALRSR